MDRKRMLDRSTVVRRARDVLFSRLDNELLAIDAQLGYCYSLNETAASIWEVIAQPAPVGAVCARLREEYAIEEETCLRDVSELLLDLREAGLVEVANGAEA